MSLQVSEINGVKTYFLTQGKTFNEFMEHSKKNNQGLKLNQEFRNRIEFIQDFDFPTACNQVQISKDQRFIIAAGVYAPVMKIYDVKELSMKCLRGMDSQSVKFCILDQDYSKLAFICEDRNIELHAQYGKHYKLRIPKHPRNMIYNEFTSDLIISASGNEIFRLNLEEGKFLQTWEGEIENPQGLDFNADLNIVITAGNNGLIQIWDQRQRQSAGVLKSNMSDISTIAQNPTNSMQFAAGDSDGKVQIFDFRGQEPTFGFSHNYFSPINQIQFVKKTIVTSDRSSLKIHNLETQSFFTSVEHEFFINSFCVVPDSSLILIASEHPRIQSIFIPALDKAPSWCPFLDNITEELEESAQQVVYDQFKFITQAQLEFVQATHLIGTKMVKPYLHGYLIHFKLWNKLKSSQDFSWEEYQKKQIDKQVQEEIEKEQEQKGYKMKASKKSKVNSEFGEQVQDKRFKRMLENEDFKIDYQSAEWKRLHPSESQHQRIGREEDLGEGEGEKQRSFINQEYIKKVEKMGQQKVKSIHKKVKKVGKGKKQTKKTKKSFGFKL